MSWFFANPTSFDNSFTETINNNPINLNLVSTQPTTVQHTPVGTSESLHAIQYVIDSPSANLYTYYPSEAARDADYALLLAQIDQADTAKAGWFAATPATFTNGSGEDIVNKRINLDIASSVSIGLAKPLATSDLLPAIIFEVTGKSSVQYLYYPDTSTRDADYALIETAVGTVGSGGSLPVLTFIEGPGLVASGLSNGPWNLVSLGVGYANKVVLIHVTNGSNANTSRSAGVRAVGDSGAMRTIGGQSTTAFKVQTDDNGDIEVRQLGSGVSYRFSGFFEIVAS